MTAGINSAASDTAREDTVDPVQETKNDAPAERERREATGPAERREWNIPEYEDVDTTPEVTSYSARR